MTRKFWLMLFAACVGLASLAWAQPAPALDPFPPITLKPGATVELSLHGRHLGKVESIGLGDARGVKVQVLRPDKPADDSLGVQISATSDAALGERSMRLVSPSGVTPPIRLLVSQYDVLPVQPSTEPQEIKLPATLSGRIGTPGDIDRFRFHAAPGQRMIFDVSARRTASPLEAVLTIQSLDGREVRCALEHHAGDAMLVFDPPRDDDYILHVRDLRYRGGPEYGYRITAGHIPYLEGLLPGSGKPGSVIKARPVGHNLEGAGPVTIDLTNAPPGRIQVRARGPLGISNDVPFEVTELPQTVESEPNNQPAEANLVPLPAEISGSLDAQGDEDFFRFHVPYKQTVSLEVLAGRYGSTVTPLLELRNVKGEIIESNDGIPDADARILRELNAGDYLASVRDLAYAGGPGHWYRLKIESGRELQPDFVVRFLPDALRLHRGGNVAVWCDVRRLNGFRGDVTINPEQLPSGVSSAAITLPDNASGWITFSAGAQPKLGTAPIRLRAKATVGAVPVSHLAEPQPAGDAYLTVLETSPFHIETAATLTPQQIDQVNGQIQSLAAKLQNPDPRIEAAKAQWETKLPKRPIWTVLEAKSAESSKGAKLLRQSDSSILAHGPFPDHDEYTVIAHTGLKNLTAVRLEVLADDRLPARGPGAAPNGNFVLSEFTVFATKGDAKQQLALRDASADFSQPQFPIAGAIDGNTETGWAIDNQEGRNHTAIFKTASPTTFDGGATLTFVLRHQSQFPQHNIGRFRISVTDVSESLLKDVAGVPASILALAATPSEQRSPAQRAELASYYRGINPQTIGMRNRLQALRQFIAPYTELRRLQTALTAGNPQLDAEQSRWEQEMARGEGWSILTITSATATSPLVREADGSFSAVGTSPTTDTYHVTGTTPLKGITALRLELLPDPRLPGGGPGRADDGSFVMTRFKVTATAKGSATSNEILFTRARATSEQKEFPISSLSAEGSGAGWSAGAGAALPAEATFYPEHPIGDDGGASLSISIEQLSKLPRHTIGRFRIWATSNSEPDKAMRAPANIVAILATAAPARSNVQKRLLSEYVRSIAPSLDPVRERLAELRESLPAVPLAVRRNQIASIPLLIDRKDGFKGDVTVTLEGFVTGRIAGKPPAIAKQIKVSPLVINADKQFGILTLQPDRTADLATRMVVLKAEMKMGEETITEYSPAFPLTISN